MQQPETPPVDAAAELTAGRPMPSDAISRVDVHTKTGQVEVYLACPFRSDSGMGDDADNLSGDERYLAQAQTAIKDYVTIRHLCESGFGPLGAKVRVIPYRWSHEVPVEQLRAVFWACMEWYGEEEAVASNWLRHADWTVRTASASTEGDRLTSYVVSFTLRNDAERTALLRKEAGQWMERNAQIVFGLDVRCQMLIDDGADQKSEAFRQELAERERMEVMDIVARDIEAAKQVKDKPQDTSGERPFRRFKKDDDEPAKPLTLGRNIDGPSISIHDIADEMRRVAIEGRVFNVDVRTLPSGRTLVQFNITDESDSITAKYFTNNERQVEALAPLQDGLSLRIQGQVQFDTYSKELVFMVQDMMPVDGAARMDVAEEKRVELHLHTTMSALDGVTPFAEYVKQAANWGHSAIALTDHGVVQEFPHAYDLGKKHGVKVLLGVEAYVVDDGTPIVYRATDMALNDDTSYVVFDTETTGLNAREDTLIEIAAVKMRGKQIVDTFSSLIDPERGLSPKITEITGISADMLVGQPKLPEVLPNFRAFAEGSVLVAHNAEFDVGFLGQCAGRIGMEAWTQPVVDTLALARVLYPGQKNYRLKTLTQKFAVELVNHHRALADAEATGKVFAKMQETITERGATTLRQLNEMSSGIDVSRVRPFHATILVRNQTGLRNLYELVSLSLTQYLHRTPRIPRSELVRFREGLLVGSACQNGEVIQAFLRGKSIEEIDEICGFYDYLEIQPPSHYENLIRDEMVQSIQSIRDIHKQVVDIGKRLDKPVVATGDVHFLNPQDGVFREVFLQSQNGSDAVFQPPLYLRTTHEMLDEFHYLGEEDARDIVVSNPRWVSEQIEEVKPIPDDLYTPVIDGAEDEIRNMSYDRARHLYGDNLPEIVEKRLEKELHSIISNGFAVIYLIAHKLVVKSLSDGYLVGSRGSVGSSLVATMTDITEVNPLPPHYRCTECRYSEFIDDGSSGSGFDLPEKNCPRCGHGLAKDGQDIPFETFLGFEGDKVPDIDLNFSGEYQPRAHKYTEELFGKDHVFRAGTISAVAEKTAYGYVRKFAEERGLIMRNAEVDRLVKGCTGIKRTTGQHPGGQIVVPRHESIYNFTPIQYPADDKNAGTFTTHFDYHSGLEKCLLKLDILGHDDPTVIRMLQDLTGVDPKTIPLDDALVLGLFSGTETLGVNPKDIRSVTGTYAIPEFGTKFVRQMLEDTRPTTFSELVRISGLSHGTDVWLNNAQELIRKGTATLSEVICARDDIMVYLIYKGLEPGRAFKIMEGIRKGKGVKEEDEQYMKDFSVPDWYIESGRRIKYMFPKAHAAAYVLMAVRIAWFKIHHPLAFYATYFSIRADDFDVALMASGREAILGKMDEIEQKGNAAAPKEKGLLTALEVALEMVVRGYRFLPIDLYQSHSTKFRVKEDEKALLPPFAAIPGVGESAANSLYQACQDGEFLSIEDMQSRSRVTKTVVEILDGLGCLAGLPETNQLSLF
jgi:DNA polymerase III subunit alpha, Gram-positive type